MIYTIFWMFIIWLRIGLFYYSPQRKWMSAFPRFRGLVESVIRRVLGLIWIPEKPQGIVKTDI